MEITPVGTFTLGWGEGLLWDDERDRLWFVDCAAGTLHWLDDGETDLGTMTMQGPGDHPDEAPVTPIRLDR